MSYKDHCLIRTFYYNRLCIGYNASSSLCQRFGLTRSVRNNPRSASIERRRRKSPPEAKDERREPFAGGPRDFAKICFHLFIRRALTHKSKAKPLQKATHHQVFTLKRSHHKKSNLDIYDSCVCLFVSCFKRIH